mgnify:FL=1
MAANRIGKYVAIARFSARMCDFNSRLDRTMQPCRDALPADYDAVKAINRESPEALSLLDADYFAQLLDLSDYFRVIELEDEVAGYLFAITHRAAYDGEEFQWFRQHYAAPFLYIDQIAITTTARQQGLAQLLYRDLQACALEAGAQYLLCEVNYRPFNTASQKFHRRLGFVQVGLLQTREVTVSLLAKKLD